MAPPPSHLGQSIPARSSTRLPTPSSHPASSAYHPSLPPRLPPQVATRQSLLNFLPVCSTSSLPFRLPVCSTSSRLIPQVATRQSLLNFQDVLNEADGIIINRGTLGLDCLPEKMAMVQKTLIKVRGMRAKGPEMSVFFMRCVRIRLPLSPLSPQVCNMMGKPVILTRIRSPPHPPPPRSAT